MIQTHSNDPDVTRAAAEAHELLARTLARLPPAETFDYGGHTLTLTEYGICEDCTRPIAEAQAAEQVLRTDITLLDDDVVKEHLELAARLFQLEAEAAIVRAQFHNGHSTENILNDILGFQYERHIGDEYEHSHRGGSA